MQRLLLLSFLVLACTAQLNADENILTTAARNGSFTTLTNLVVAADLDEVLQSDNHFTVFAPTDEAFSALPQGTLEQLLLAENREQLAELLKYHVLGTAISIADHPPADPIDGAKTLQGTTVSFSRKGSQVRVNESLVIARNIKCSNGIIHVIDRVLTPPPQQPNLLELVSSQDQFTTLTTAIKAAGLTDLLASDKRLTILAPTNAAFAKLSTDRLARLLKPENRDQLIELLSYHVIEGDVSAKQAIQAETFETLNGRTVQFSIVKGQLQVNDSKITRNDLEASNGTVHIIDTVLMPPSGQSKRGESSAMTEQEDGTVRISANWRQAVNEDGIVANRLEIDCGASGRIKLTNVRVNEIVTRIAGGGRVEISGNAKNHRATVYGGATLNAANLGTESSTLDVAGGATALVNALAKLNVTAAAGATVRYLETGVDIKKSITPYTVFEPLAVSSPSHD